MAPSKKSSSTAATPGSATVKVNTSTINAKDALTTAPAPKPWALILSIWGALLAVFVVDSSRQFVCDFALQSWLHAAGSLFVLTATLLYSFSLLRTEEWRGGGVAGIFNHSDYSGMEKKVDQSIDSFLDNFSEASRAGDGSHDQKLAQRKANYMNMVNHFYDLVTDFYEYGWGDCFHFGFRFAGEGFHESIRRTEYYLASRIGLNANTHAVDVGCGVGGPMRNIARFTGSKITGINNNGYQIKVGTKHNIRWGLEKQCSFLQSDFMKINVPDATFDHAYAIEATCHAPDKVGCYKEVFRLIKPGGYFGAYEWCVTPQYDAKNPRHVAIREGIEIGNSLPVLATFDEVTTALRKAGFEVVDSFNAQRDAHAGPQHVPWYQSLAGEYSLAGFRMTPVGRAVTHAFVTTLEFMRIAPKGSTKVSKLLNDTAIDLVDGGRLEIFTPSFFVLARKPLNA